MTEAQTREESGKIVILGSGGHALAVWDACVSAGFTPIGFVDPAEGLSRVSGLWVASSVSGIDFSTVEVALGVGNNYSREQSLVELLQQHPEVRLPAIVHQTAWVSPNALLHPGSVVMAHASVGPFAVAGRGSLLNTGASLNHESKLGDFASLGPGAHTGGQVVIGARTMVGLNAGILQGISVGADTVIGGQSLVRTDIPAETLAFGVPCTPVRARSASEQYF